MRCWFSPNGGALAALVEAVDGAQNEVLLQAFVLGSVPLMGALNRAKRRGVTVRAVCNAKSARKRGSTIKGFAKQHEVWLDGEHSIAHNKVLIVDRKMLYTGSYNFTRAAEFVNAENLLEVVDEETVAKYVTNWELHRAHSRGPI